jgi:hypothetical protein
MITSYSAREPLRSVATLETRRILIAMFKNRIFEIGEHHGMSSDGTQTMKILVI